MKRTLIGIVLLLSATFTEIGILLSASMMSMDLTEWNGTIGKMWTAVIENGLLVPFILTTITWVIAIIILGKEYFKKEE